MMMSRFSAAIELLFLLLGLNLGSFATGDSRGLDLLQSLKSDQTIKGITKTQGKDEHSDVWRFRSYANVITLPGSEVGEFGDDVTDGALSLYYHAKQSKSSVGSLLHILSGNNSELLFSLVSDIPQKKLILQYRSQESFEIRETVFEVPTINHRKWTRTLLVVEGDRVKLYSDCDINLEEKLPRKIELNFPEDTRIYLGQTPQGKDRFTGWLQEAWIYPEALAQVPWSCQQSQEDESVELEGQATLVPQQEVAETGHQVTSKGNIQELPQSDAPDNTDAQRVVLLEDMVSQLTNMMNMMKVQMAEMDRKVSYLEGCECVRLEVCEYNGKDYKDEESWEVDPCRRCVCQSGVAKCQIYQDRPECLDPCVSNPCPSNARCVGYPGYNNFTCICPDGQEGPNCEANVNVCTQPAEFGTCGESLQRHHYNPYTQRCEQFLFSGCGGNDNNFESKRRCEEKCVIGACCQRTYTRTSPGLTFLSFRVLEPGFKCEIQSIHECKRLMEITETTDKRQEVVSFLPGQGCRDGVCGLPSGCIFGSQIYRAGDRFRTNCQECTCQADGNIVCRCDTLTVRKEIRDMTRVEIERFQSAVRKLQSSHYGNLWEELHNLYMRHVMHANGPMYLPWHRIFLRRVEQQLQEIDCAVTLPYFDFTTDVGNMSDAVIWQANYFGGDGRGGCVPDFPFQGAEPWKPCLRRNLNPNIQLPSMVDFYVALSSDDFNEMSRCLQLYVSYFHEFVGGDMATSGSTYDPLFFALHSYIDMLYWRWQNKNGNLQNFPDFMKSIPMVPFNIRPEDVFNLEQQLCVTYILPSFGDPCNGTAFVFGEDGYDHQGFDMQGFNRQGYDGFGYDMQGYDLRGELDDRNVYSFDGFDEHGYNRAGYDRLGYNRYGYSQDGYNRDGFTIQGYDRTGYDRYGYTYQGYDRRGFDSAGFDIDGNPDNSGFYSENGFNYYCLDRRGLNPEGFDRYGYNMEMHDEEYCSYSFNGPHIIKTAYRVQEILYRQNKNFLMSIPRTCVELQPLPVSWYEQVWILNPKGVPVSVVREVTQYPEQSASQRFCLEVEKILDYCVCEETLVECPENPCEVEECPGFPDATCFIDFCQECKAKWVYDDKEVDCEFPTDPCSNNPCQNGGTCRAESNWPNEPQLYTCDCVPPYTGKNCEKKQFDVCTLPRDSGNSDCGSETMQWYFNMAAMECEQFLYSGCHGNANRFASYGECQRSCMIGACCWRTPSNPDGVIGYDVNGFDRYGFNVDGFNEEGLSHVDAQALNGDLVYSEYDQDGFDRNGCDRQGYDGLGYHCITGFNITGYNRIGEFDGITVYDKFGYDQEGYNRAEFDCNGVNRHGYDYLGLNVGYVYECRAMNMMDCQAMEEGSGSRREVLKFSLGKRCEEVQCDDVCGCEFNGRRYRIGQTFQFGCQQCTCTQAGSVQCACDGIIKRREIRDLTPDEMKRYQNAIKSLHLHTGNPSTWHYFANQHAESIPQAYGSESFLPWHRYFLRAVEMELQEIDCGIAIPYFDWAIDAGAMDSSVAWQANYFGGDGASGTDCVLHHPFKEHWPENWGPCLRRKFNSDIQLPDAVNFQFIINEPSYEEFRLQLEAASGLFHLWVGGHMATPYSPYDPIFLSHFAFIDMIWDIWQQRNPHGISRYPASLRYTHMSPWQTTPDEVLENQDQMCVEYVFPTEGVICNIESRSFPIDEEGYDRHGYDSEGYDRYGYNVHGYNRNGLPDTRGIYDLNGYNREGYRRNGFDDSGYDVHGYNTDDLNRDGFDVYGYDISGYNRYGFDQSGVTPFGFTRDGVYQPGVDESEYFDSAGYNHYGLDKYGLDRENRDAFGFTRDGFDKYHCNAFFNGSYYLLYFHKVFVELLNATDDQLININRICQGISPLPEWWLTKNWLTRNNQVQLIRVVEGAWLREHPVTDSFVPRHSSVTEENLWLPITPDERFCFEIRHYCECPIWLLPVGCPDDLCHGEICESNPSALCRVNNCGQCTIQWYDGLTGEVIECQSTDCIDDNGDRHRVGSRWQRDRCTTCTCEVDQEVSCRAVPCVETLCTHPYKPEGECCPICSDCFYLGREIRNGEEFNPFDERCQTCACLNGNVMCRGIDCPPVDCENPRIPDGECCPRCGGGCEYQGRLLGDRERYQLDHCTVCVCVRGTVQCQGPEDCPVLSCLNQYIPEGECCARCRDGCEYDDRMFDNGDFFTPSTNPCLRCSCAMSIVRCNPISCPEVPCSNPVKPLGACCEVCSDKCLYGGEEYRTGDTWRSADGCKQCTCHHGDTECVDIVPCTITCTHGALRAGQCCSPCTDCSYNDQFIRNGLTFAAGGDECNQCVCRDGKIICQREECPRIDCIETESVEGSCCPVCKGCVDSAGRRYEHNAEWKPLDEDCDICRCREGQINCESERCTQTCSHPITKPDVCCPLCDGCLYEGQEYPNGGYVNGENKCKNCICRDGSVECIDIDCPQLGCTNPVYIPGTCCPICEDCIYDGQEYENGETFTDPRSPCLECTCLNTQVDCRRLDLDCNPDCMHPGRLADVCCPVCDICEYDRRNYRNGAVFRPDDGDICNFCTCVDGTVTCQTEACPPLQCRNPVQKPDMCCPECDVCMADGQEHSEGEVWESLADPCAICTCTDTRVRCRNKDCPISPCRHPARMAGDCCSSCDNCLYDRRLFRNGQRFRDPLNNCHECICEDGNVDCQQIECPSLSCKDFVTPEGECCPRCSEDDCEYQGQRYDNRERFENPINHCEECMCVDGLVTCSRKRCPPVACPNPRRGPCCDMCDGCTYNGVSYDTGETFTDPRERCKECSCEDGYVECRDIECDDVACTHPITRPGDCCPVCEACVYEGRRVASGQTFSDPTDQCKTCTCDSGSVVCEQITCNPVQCTDPAVDNCGCHTCYDCLYQGQSYPNGQTFTNPDDDCQTCRCWNGNINCVTKTCPRAQCSDPVRDACSCPVCQDCFYLNSNYKNRESFMEPNDPCSRCQCVDGSVGCAHVPCPPVTCANPVRKLGECCPECPDECLPVLNPDPCQECTCVSGEWDCVNRECPRISCSHPVQGQCCPECTDCLYDGRTFRSSEMFPDPTNQCRLCRCLDGNVDCIRQTCRVPSCNNPAVDQCGCPTCEECEFIGERYRDGEQFEDPRQPCYICQCLSGDVNCQQVACPPALCSNPVSELGGCCPVCLQETCEVDGVIYDEGDTWISNEDPCQECLCLSGEITCHPVDCPRSCSHPQVIDGECCPLCEGCTYEGVDYEEGMAFNPPNDVCSRCQCVAGNVLCMNVACPRPDCSNPVSVPGECCPVCTGCVHNGQEYRDGSQWTSTSNPCEQCQCRGIEVRCNIMPCPDVTCSHPVRTGCCPSCHACLYDNTQYSLEEVFNPDECTTCQCRDGNVQCQRQQCPPLTCPYTTKDPGQCCDRCQGCIVDGVEYRDGETWVSDNNPCQSCECQAGTESCIEIQCVIPETCANRVFLPGQCCPLCQGCIYNGINYDNGETFSPTGDPCETCTCENGTPRCFRQTCPSFSDCPSDRIVPPKPGECCGKCGAIPSTGSNCTDKTIGWKVQPTEDPCFVCECKDASTWQCETISCPVLSCSESERRKGDNDCCFSCDRCYIQFDGRYYEDGDTWIDPGNNCITCSCNGGAVTCDTEICEPLACEEGFDPYRPPDKCCDICRDTNIPCQYGDAVYQPKERWIKDECTSCECKFGEVHCVTTRCPPIVCLSSESPTITPGKCCPRCEPKPATCVAFGDPHYRTFDGKMIHFQGTCKYVMSMDCENQDYIVEVQNDDRGAFGAVSWTQEVTVTVSGLEVHLGQSGLVEVNGHAVTLPYLRQPLLYIEMKAGNNFFINTEIGLQVHWDGNSYLEISIPGTYSGNTCGLCGNFNTYPQDDLRMRSGQITTSVSKFGNSWKVLDPDQEECEDARDIDPCTEAGYRARKLANAKCAVLKSPRFSKCHPVVSPEPFFASCVYDMCACGSDDSCLCDVLSAYAAECRQSGVALSWRSTSLCAIQCPEDRGLIFDECGPRCPRTCENKDVPIGVIEAQCFRPCVPGCQCRADKVLFDARCIDPEDCPAILYGNATVT